MNPEQWASLSHLRSCDFSKPYGLDYSIVSALDHFINLIGSRPVILSDFRPGDPKTHGQGLAIDTAWPGVDPMSVYQQAMMFPRFGGVGIYVNEAGAASFHFDTRQTTLRDYGPDRWGGIIRRAPDPDTQGMKNRIDYVSAETVLNMLKKKGPLLMVLVVVAVSVYLLMSQK